MHAELADPRADIDWLTAHLAQFVAEPASIPARGLTKRCAELAMTCSYLRGWVREGSLPAQPFAGQLNAWQRALERRCEDRGQRRRALADPAAALFHAQPYMWLRATGYRENAWEQALAGLSSAGVRPMSMGVLHLLWKAGLMRRQPDWRAALARWLAAWADDPDAWDHNAYRVTHAAFYISDLGNQAAPVAPGDLDRLVDASRRLLDRAVARRRWDLAGELLTALTCLGREDDAHPQATRAFCASRRAHEPAVPGRTPGETFRRRYHTTIVNVLRCAVATRAAGLAA
jgi:hypothetical protein